MLNPLTAEWALRAPIDFTLSNARRFYSSMGNPLDGKGLIGISTTEKNRISPRKNYHNFNVVEIANQLVTRHSLHLAPWMSGNAFSILSSESNERLGVQLDISRVSAELKTQREIPYLCAPLYYLPLKSKVFFFLNSTLFTPQILTLPTTLTVLTMHMLQYL